MIPGFGRRPRVRRLSVRDIGLRAIAVAAIATAGPLLGVSPAHATITSPDAASIANALAAAGTSVGGASWVTVPIGEVDANGVSDAPLGGFPTEGSSFAVLTTGDVRSVDDAPPSTHNGTTTELGGNNFRGDTDFDVSVLKVDFTVGAGMNCVRFDFRFLSDEYPEYLGGRYNDAFIAELDTSDWSTSGSTITAPNNFAFDPDHHPISINAAGATSMSAGPLDTTYDGATPTLSAAHAASPGAHSLYLSIFDQGDQRVDSAVFVDNLVVGYAANPDVQCAAGAAPKSYGLSLAPATATKTVGTSHTVTASVESIGAQNGAVSGGKVLFSVAGANTATGTATVNSSGLATYTYSGSHTGKDTITACYDANDNATCDAGDPFDTVAATWTAPLPTTGRPIALIAGLGVLAAAVGALAFVLVRRRRVRFVAQ